MVALSICLCLHCIRGNIGSHLISYSHLYHDGWQTLSTDFLKQIQKLQNYLSATSSYSRNIIRFKTCNKSDNRISERKLFRLQSHLFFVLTTYDLSFATYFSTLEPTLHLTFVSVTSQHSLSDVSEFEATTAVPYVHFLNNTNASLFHRLSTSLSKYSRATVPCDNLKSKDCNDT